MLNNLLFLSKGLQIALVCVVVCIIMILARIAAMNDELKTLKAKQLECVQHDEFMEFFRSYWLEMASGGAL